MAVLAALSVVFSLFLVSAGCGAVQIRSAKDFAVQACNEWARALDAPPDDFRKLFRGAVNSAQTASEMDQAYAPLSGGFDQMLAAGEAQDIERLEIANGITFDECNKVTGASEQLRREIDRLSPR